MEAGSARRRLAVRPDEATIEAHGVAAYAAEGIGTFLLVFFICAAISGFWIYVLGLVTDALLAALG
jgi:hypothetical protein